MHAPSPAHELVAALTRAAAALDLGDSDTATAEMASAADLCRRLQTAGIALPSSELGRLRELYDRCGIALDRIGQELNAAGFRDDQQRRGMEAYQATTVRTR
jgi:hypothetical protein